MDVARLTELRLTSFKSFKGESMPLEPLTLLVGPNASGKSNSLDALTLLTLLAEERSIADLERDDREVAGLRGGLTGSIPFSGDSVSVGCTVSVGDTDYFLDVDFDISGVDPEIRSERLVAKPKRGVSRTLLSAESHGRGQGIADVEVYSGTRPRIFQMLTSRLITAQATTKVPQDTQARTLVVEACQVVIAVLRGVLVLDPVPGEMRSYARIGTSVDRLGTTTSAVLYSLRDDEVAWGRLVRLVKGLVGRRLVDVEFVEARLPTANRGELSKSRPVDVMVALREDFAGEQKLAPASVISDGTLRYMSIVATLLSLGKNREPNETRRQDVEIARTLVVEEVENGLYPTQAAAVLGLLRDEALNNGVTLIATTHSPALLDALEPEDHIGVLVCGRRENERSFLVPLVDHPNYIRLAGGGGLGQAVAKGELDAPANSGNFADLLPA